MELIVENKNDNKIYNFSDIAQKISFSSQMRGGASSLKFDYYGAEMIGSGSLVRFRYSDKDIFFGYVFSCSTGADGKVSVTVYDQLRYFKSKDLFPQYNMKLSDVVNEICEKFKFYIGKVDDTECVLKDKGYYNKTLLDICYSGIDETLLSTGKKFVLMDNYGKIELRDAENLRLDLVLGDGMDVYGYSYSRGIDGKSYNRIKLLKKSEKTLVDFCVEESEESKSRWGILQYCEAMDKKSMGELQKIAKDLLRLYNREDEKLSLKCFGDTRVRGGSGIYVLLEDIGIKSWFMVDKVTHTFTKDLHTMDLELRI